MTTTGTVEETVIDPSGKTVPATVNLVSESTKDLRTITAGENGKHHTPDSRHLSAPASR